jgi:APA family basic amino acid/polyamine antiporter
MILGEVTQNIAKHGHFPKAWAKENRYGAPTIALFLTGAIASVMLLSNYTQSINGLFTLLSVIVTAANLPMYFACTLAVVAIGWRGTVSAESRPSRWLMVAASCAALYCMWASVGIGLKPLLWTVALCACCAPVYWRSRRQILQVQSE